jgi:hypothetical protein
MKQLTNQPTQRRLAGDSILYIEGRQIRRVKY